MKNRYILVISIIFLIFSCDHFVNLGDKSSDATDNTEGLPDEISEDGRNSDPVDGNYDDWNEDNSTDTGYYDDTENGAPGSSDSADNGSETDQADSDTGNTDSGDSDTEGPDEIPDEDYIFPESGNPFPEEFSNVECGCGSTPDYFPVCCDGKISVFNACFANCYAVNSIRKICSSYKTGLCVGSENNSGDADEETPENNTEENDHDINDNDNEIPDSDTAAIENECGCYPEDEVAIFKCGKDDSYAITSCIADCHCDDPQKIFF